MASRALRVLARLAASAVLLFGLTVGTAYAFWSNVGAGSGAATDGTFHGIVLNAVGTHTPDSLLLPGTGTPASPGPGIADIVLNITNPYTAAVAVTLVSFTPSGAVTVAGNAGCTTANAKVTFLTKTGMVVTIPAGTHDVIVPLAVEMASDSASLCQGAAFTIDAAIQVQQ